jgi:hypothetical protein
MSKFKIEHGASKVNLVLLKTNIEGTIAEDIDRMATWSDNDRKYIVNELLRFALAQEEDFQRYKASPAAKATQSVGDTKTASASTKRVSDAAPKSEPSSTGSTAHA